MKLRILWILIATTFSTLMAQPSFSSSDFISIGDVIKTYSRTSSSAISPGSAGANQTWDFSGIAGPGSPTSTVYYISPAGTPYASQFPNANLTERIEDDNGVNIYSYSEKNSSSASYLGFGSPDLSYTHSDPEKYAVFPFTYNTSFMDSFAATVTTAAYTSNRTGDLSFVGDGYGTLKLPTGTYTNVLRVKHIQNITDTISVSGFVTTIHTQTISYAWIAEGFRYALFSLVEANVTTKTGLGKNASVQKEAAYALSFTNIALSSAGTLSGGGNGGGDSVETRWIPHVTKVGAGFETTMELYNAGSSSATVVLNPYTSAGVALTPRTVTLAANKLQVSSSSSLFGGEDVGQIGITGSSDIIVSAAYRAATGDGASGHLHETSNAKTEFWLYQGERNVVFDGIAAVNTGTETASITATLYGLNHEVLGTANLTNSLASRGKYITVFDGVLPDTTNGIIKIAATQPIVVTFLRGTRVGVSPAYLYANNPVSSDASASDDGSVESRWISHVTRSGGGFQTSIYLYNTSSSSATVVLQPYTSAGTALTAKSLTLAGNKLQVSLSDELFGGEDVGQIGITGSSNIIVSAAYKAAEGEGASGHLHESAQGKSEYWLYQGERNVVFDGLAAVNLGSSTATVTATLYDLNHNVLGTATLTNTLASRGKFISVFDGVLPDTTEGIIRIQSTQPIEVTFLRGTRVGVSPAYLYANNPAGN